MNFYWRVNIVGLLRHAAESIPEVRDRCLTAAAELDRTLTSAWLEEAFSAFQAATVYSHDPIYVTGGFYAMQALAEVRRYEENAGQTMQVVRDQEGEHVLPGGPNTEPPGSPEQEGAGSREASSEAEQGMLELFDRIRRGATLEEALSLFPLLGEESNPQD